MAHKNKKWHNLNTRYGVSKEEFLLKLKEQKHKCAICGCKSDKDGNGLCLDHCHKSNAKRDLLCKYCNSALGFALDNKKIVKKMLKYLQKHTGIK